MSVIVIYLFFRARFFRKTLSGDTDDSVWVFCEFFNADETRSSDRDFVFALFSVVARGVIRHSRSVFTSY